MRNKKLFAYAMIAAGCFLALSSIVGRTIHDRHEEERKMNDLEKHYDADGPMVIINSEIGLIGVYDGYVALQHIWAARAKHSPSGLYRLVIHEDRIGLGRPDTEWIFEIPLHEKDVLKITENVAPGIPVLVY